MNWKDYEDKIFEKFDSEFGSTHEIIKNTHIIGKFSKTPRQIDILLKSKIAHYSVLGVVECKYFSKKVDVKIVDSFIGFLEDVGANFGVIITNEGYTHGAQNRAYVKGIRLEIIKFAELEEYHYDLEFCQICETDEDGFGRIINYDGPVAFMLNGVAYIVEVGRCDYCNSIHIRCGSCGNTIPVYDSEYNELLECSCGLHYYIMTVYDKDAIKSSYLFFYNQETNERVLICSL